MKQYESNHVSIADVSSRTLVSFFVRNVKDLIS